MGKKLLFGLKTKAIGGTPPKWLSMATAIVGLLLVAKHQLVGDMPGIADTVKEVASEWYDYVMNIAQVALSLAVIFTGYDEDKPDTDNVYSGYSKNGVKIVLLLIISTVYMMLSSCSKKTLDVRHSSSYIDTSWTTLTNVPVQVKGGATPAVNMDSIKQLIEQYLTRSYNPEHPGINTLPPDIINKIYTIPDTSGRFELQYWISTTGEMMARCVAKDETINALVEQNNRLIQKSESTTQVQTVYKTPGWFKWLMGAGIVAVVVFFFKDMILKWLRGK